MLWAHSSLMDICLMVQDGGDRKTDAERREKEKGKGEK